MSICFDKKTLRQKYLQMRSHLEENEWKWKCDLISRHLLDSELVQKSHLILSYISHKKEPDLGLLYQNCSTLWGIPRCQGKKLTWHYWNWGKTLDKGAYGILEPKADDTPIDHNKVDLIIIPAVACDAQGYRLGYGGGYYDRMLASPLWQNIPTIGIVFDFAYTLELPHESWDKPLKYICTEEGFKSL